MTNGLNGNNVKWLTFLVYFLLAVLTFVTGYTQVEIKAMKDEQPKQYVRLERYKCDIGMISKQMDRIIKKLDEK